MRALLDNLIASGYNLSQLRIRCLPRGLTNAAQSTFSLKFLHFCTFEVCLSHFQATVYNLYIARQQCPFPQGLGGTYAEALNCECFENAH